MATFSLRSLRGGLNDSDPPSALPEDQCTEATNAEFTNSMLGERRRGALEIDLSGSDLAACDRIVWGHRHLPTADLADAQCWALGITDPSTAVLAYKDTSWHTVSMTDALTIDGVSEYQVQGLSLHGKLFIAYNSSVDRLHVWDGTSLRRTGLAEPAAPTGADDGGTGTFTGDRYYRVRYIAKSGSTILRRSEPSDVLTFSPNGNDTGAVVTKPAAISEGETHWELEASTDNANFYLIATTVVGTTTVTDTQDYVTGYGEFPLSEDIGDYTLIPSVKFLAADDDRVVTGSSHEDVNLTSRIAWTPVGKADGVGNDERMEADTDPFVDLDALEGGGLTGLVTGVQGYLYACKWSHFYQGVRSGVRTAAYKFYCWTKERGALPGSMVRALDQNGNAVLYMLDPAIGPTRAGSRGILQACGADIRTTWATVNADAAEVVSRSLYDPKTRQVHFWVATNDSDTPNLRLVLQTNEMQDTENNGARRGWAKWTGDSSEALTVWLFSDNIDADTDRNHSLRPFIGREGDGLIWRCDTGTTDNGTAYAARVVSRPFSPATILNHAEVKSGAVLGAAVSGAAIDVTVIRDYGLGEDTSASVSFTPTGSEAHVIRPMDDLQMAELRSVQFAIEDVSSPTARWEVNELVVREETGQAA